MLHCFMLYQKMGGKWCCLCTHGRHKPDPLRHPDFLIPIPGSTPRHCWQTLEVRTHPGAGWTNGSLKPSGRARPRVSSFQTNEVRALSSMKHTKSPWKQQENNQHPNFTTVSEIHNLPQENHRIPSCGHGFQVGKRPPIPGAACSTARPLLELPRQRPRPGGVTQGCQVVSSTACGGWRWGGGVGGVDEASLFFLRISLSLSLTYILHILTYIYIHNIIYTYYIQIKIRSRNLHIYIYICKDIVVYYITTYDLIKLVLKQEWMTRCKEKIVEHSDIIWYTTL
jgi:hypothetical protein